MRYLILFNPPEALAQIPVPSVQFSAMTKF